MEFVRELHQRWFDRHPVRPSPALTPSREESLPEMVRGSVFISYASEDRTAAFRLADRLGEAGLEVWVDRRLQPGDRYADLIRQHIQSASAFVPVLSQNTQSGQARWFRREWKIACEFDETFFGSPRPFLFPVVADDTPLTQLSSLCAGVFKRTADRAPGGEPSPALVGALDRTQKDWRRQNSRT